MKGVLEIEIDGGANESLFFAPLQRRIRGRFDVNRVAEPLARMKARDWPQPIPGQRLGINLESGEAYLAEPLREPQHAAIRDRVERLGKVGPDSEPFGIVHLPTWLHWLKRAVGSGIARVVKGELPTKIDGEPRRSFIHAEPAPSTNDRLAAAIDANTRMLGELLKTLRK